MNIALIGYGKMGKAIERVAQERGHEIVLKISTANKHELTKENIQKADIVIEFTGPESAKENVELCLKAGVPVISGSTGWNEHLSHAEYLAVEHKTAFLHASNFSVGVNIFFEINKLLAKLMNTQETYDVSVTEIHHTEKKDSPSGTAITIAEQITDTLKRKNHWAKETAQQPDDLAIISFREENVPGTHTVKYTSAIDDIEITHIAHNREGFATGAVLAAEFVGKKKEGIYTMKDVLSI
ncbi:4-hydroxy-tetrahydrodipicolinate reductase [Chitinophagaceae bacterium MMS25-I14]